MNGESERQDSRCLPPVSRGTGRLSWGQPAREVVRRTPGQHAGKDAGGTANTDGINQAEMTWADTYVQDGLNKRVTDGIAAANANGGAEIQFVGGIKAKFAKHGYSAAIVDAEPIWVRDGDVRTSAGVTAGMV